MTYLLLQPEHIAHLYLGVFGPALLVALTAVHFVTRTWTPVAVWWHDPDADALVAAVLEDEPEVPTAEPAELEVEHVGVLDNADTTEWLGDLHHDGEPEQVDVFSLTLAAREEEIEAALDWVHRLEQEIALETAVTFGFVYLGAPR